MKRRSHLNVVLPRWLFLLFGMVWVFAVSAQDAKISINVNKQPLAQVLSELERQTNYKFFYSNELVAGVALVTIKVANKPLSSVLQRILPERNLTYKIEGRHIILSGTVSKVTDENKKEPSAQTITIRGRVTDSAGEPLIGVSVKSGATGVITDIDGGYSMNVTQGAQLSFSYIGYATVTQKAVESKNLDIIMTEDVKLLNEVVVIGYGTMDKKELTSAISHVSEKDFLNISSSDPARLIQGKVSGVSIVNVSAADPNASSNIQVRGVASRQAGLGPLIVIDGVPGGSMNNVNPNDIASFDVLKDGAASAIYGTRGANGVILITTKKGSKDGAVHTTYTTTLSWDKMKNELDMMDADDYRRIRLAWGDLGNDLGGNYDWLDGVSQTGFAHKHTLSLSGGNERTNYRVSVDYRDASGIDRRSMREEYGGRASINHTTKGGLFNFTANLAPRIIYSDLADWGVFSNAIEVNPTTPLMDLRNPTRYYNFIGQTATYNPVERQELEKKHCDTKLLDWDATARLNLLPLLAKSKECPVMLNTQITFADRQYVYDNSEFIPSTSTTAINSGFDGSAKRVSDTDRQYMTEWITNLSAKFGQHNVKLMGGYSYTYSHQSGHSAENRNFPNDGLGSDNLGSGDYAKDEGVLGMDSYRKDSKLIAYFGRVSYDWDGRYLVTASIRHEGSSKFGSNHKWGNFPAVSAGWRVSQEKFMESTQGWLDDLKIRGDYGETGNQDFDSYQSIPAMKGWGDYFINGKFMQVWGSESNVNPDLHWEKAKNWNIGVDFSMFKGRIAGSFNYFNRRSNDLLGTYTVSIPPYLHETTVVNVGSMSNQGFEFELSFIPVQTRNFTYNFNVVGSTIKNKFINFSNSQYVGQDYYYECWTEAPYAGYTLQRIEVGQPVGNFYMLRYAGINEKGEWMVYDKEGDIIELGLADENDRAIVGNGLPKFNLSTTHTFRYRNFDLSLFFRGAFGFDLFNIHDFYYGTRKFNGNLLKKAYGKNFDINPTSPHAATDYFLERGDYFKLEQLTLGYTLKTPHWRFMDGLRIYGSMNNVFTLTGFSGVDPSTYNVNGLTPGAIGSRGYYPSSRQFILGMQVDF
ncbi:SusC/RagA family TonB-linked outer membrane protein [Bacteroides acidifaciens]|uniref:SusC/RagA family TonB-linked outer membrane protein n=1 Tax=Bacteroides acidifaciens TaxID=85831 RepID=UPI00158945B5|nr:SusC/RagA family TonB-linked outer membrane protein [Bacteroides acidifaciens]